MATNPIGKGTKNLSVNLPESAKGVLGRLAFLRDQCLGDFVKEAIAKELRVAMDKGELTADVLKPTIQSISKTKSLLGCLMLGLLAYSVTQYTVYRIRRRDEDALIVSQEVRA